MYKKYLFFYIEFEVEFVVFLFGVDFIMFFCGVFCSGIIFM